MEENEIVPGHDLLRRAEAIAGDRDAGASELLVHLLPLLADAAQRGEPATVAVSRLVCEGQPVMAPLWNACAAAVADFRTPGRFRRVRAEMERAPAALVRAGAAALGDALLGSQLPEVLTLSFSGSVLRVLEALLGEARLRIVCGEGRPRFEGRRMAAALAAGRRAEVILTTDAAITTFLHTATAVVVGADAIGTSTWINKVGTYGLAAAASQRGIPVFVIATRDKALARPLAERWNAQSADPREVWPSPAAGVLVQNPYFERIPVELVTSFLTEVGPIPATDISTFAERHAADISLLVNQLG